MPIKLALKSISFGLIACLVCITTLAQDYKTTLKKAEEGNSKAQFNLGLMYDEGDSEVPRDKKKAIIWYTKAALQGNVKAQFNLAYIYDEGEAGKVDKLKAINWYRKAAEQNYRDAATNLAIIYENGDGVPKNQKEAAFWYDVARNGYKKNIKEDKLTSTEEKEKTTKPSPEKRINKTDETKKNKNNTSPQQVRKSIAKPVKKLETNNNSSPKKNTTKSEISIASVESGTIHPFYFEEPPSPLKNIIYLSVSITIITLVFLLILVYLIRKRRIKKEYERQIEKLRYADETNYHIDIFAHNETDIISETIEKDDTLYKDKEEDNEYIDLLKEDTVNSSVGKKIDIQTNNTETDIISPKEEEEEKPNEEPRTIASKSVQISLFEHIETLDSKEVLIEEKTIENTNHTQTESPEMSNNSTKKVSNEITKQDTVDLNEIINEDTTLRHHKLALSQFQIGLMYAEGEGVSIDKEKAFYWVHRAASYGLVEAQYYIGMCYKDGVGIAQNTNLAQSWLHRASSHNYPPASRALSELRRNEQHREL